MQWVEKRGATVEEATALALEELGVDVEAAEIRVLSQPRRGIFGGGRKAVVRATLREPATATAHPQSTAAPDADDPAGEGDDTASPMESVTAEETAADHVRASGDPADETAETPAVTTMSSTDAGDRAAVPTSNEENAVTDTTSPPQTEDVIDFDALDSEERMNLLDEECDLAADFVEGLLDLLDLPGDIEIEVSEDTAVVNVSEVGSGLLIGRRGATLDALQELVRSSTQRQTERRSHVRVDVEGYRARQLDKLRTKCRDAIAQVRETGEPVRLEPMDAYERKMMHDLIAKTGGVSSSSEGTEPKRRVVIMPE